MTAFRSQGSSILTAQNGASVTIPIPFGVVNDAAGNQVRVNNLGNQLRIDSDVAGYFKTGAASTVTAAAPSDADPSPTHIRAGVVELFGLNPRHRFIAFYGLAAGAVHVSVGEGA